MTSYIANVGTILLLHRGHPLQEVKLYCHGPVGITELILIKKLNVLCILFQNTHYHFKCEDTIVIGQIQIMLFYKIARMVMSIYKN